MINYGVKIFMNDLKCEIICVGSELLLGDIVNTNSYFITKSLAEIGISVYYHTSVGDNFDRILNSFENAFNRGMNLIITSGGLGPTDDDITKEASAKYFNKDLILNDECVKDLENILKTTKSNITEANLKQVYIPDGGEFIKNDVGTAPGVIQNFDGKIIINLPGPPRELYPMFNNYVKPYLEKFTNTKYYSEFLRLSGTNEGEINKDLTDLFENENPTLAPYVKEDDLVLRITARCNDDLHGKNLIKPFKDKVYQRVGKFIYAEGEEQIEELLFKELLKRGFKISFAESCTGGMISSRFVNFSGASQCFDESFVTYSNESKINNIGVSSDVLDKFGAVSKETAEEMVKGLANRTNSQVCVAVTGVAGPKESENKPAGLVYIGIKILDKIYVKECRFIGDRQRVREKSTFEALVSTYNILKNL